MGRTIISNGTQSISEKFIKSWLSGKNSFKDNSWFNWYRQKKDSYSKVWKIFLISPFSFYYLSFLFVSLVQFLCKTTRDADKAKEILQKLEHLRLNIVVNLKKNINLTH